MKKVMFTLSLALFLLLGLSVKAEAPTCSEGTHYVGEYVESESCENVCVKKIWGFCVKYERKCETVGNWVGECVADEVVVPEPEATSTPIVETAEGVKVIYTDSLMAVINSFCKDDQVEYSDWQDLAGFGLEIRSLKLNEVGKSVFNGCTPTGKHQAEQVRFKGSDKLGLGI